MERIKRLVETMKAQWGARGQRRSAAKRAVAVALQIALKGCRF